MQTSVPSARPPRASLQRIFLTGLLTLLPIWLTWVVVKFVFVLLSDTSRPLIGPLLHNLSMSHVAWGWLDQAWVQTALALLATLGVILLSGVMARRVVGQRLSTGRSWRGTTGARPLDPARGYDDIGFRLVRDP